MPFKTWLDKLCGPLENPKYKQIIGKLVVKDYNGNIIGKCAMGEIACQNDIKTFRVFGLGYYELSLLGIPEEFINNRSDYTLPRLYFTLQEYGVFDFKNQTAIIQDYITCLNDNGFTYKEIAEFLRTTFEDAV